MADIYASVLVMPEELVWQADGVYNTIYITADGDDLLPSAILVGVNSSGNHVAYISHRMGLGTQDPWQALHLVGSGYVSGNVLLGTSMVADETVMVNGTMQSYGSVFLSSLPVDDISSSLDLSLISIVEWLYYQPVGTMIGFLQQSSVFAQWIESVYNELFVPWWANSTDDVVTMQSLGIGVVSPSSSLHIYGTMRIDPEYIGDLQPDIDGNCRMLTLDSNNHVVLGILPGCSP